MATKSSDFENCISLEEYLRAHGVDPSMEEKTTLTIFMLLLHQFKNDTTLFEVRPEGGIFPVYGRDWMNRFTPMLSKDEAVLQEVSEALQNSCDDLRRHIGVALRVSFEEWAQEYDLDTSSITDKAKMRGIRRAQRDLGVPNYHRAILDRETGQIDVQPEYPFWLLNSIDWSIAK